jgi:hypothetical protein
LLLRPSLILGSHKTNLGEGFNKETSTLEFQDCSITFGGPHQIIVKEELRHPYGFEKEFERRKEGKIK